MARRAGGVVNQCLIARKGSTAIFAVGGAAIIHRLLLATNFGVMMWCVGKLSGCNQ
jgi:hypothetical protein